MAVKKTSSQVGGKVPPKAGKKPQKPAKASVAAASQTPERALSEGWLQDVSVEFPVPPGISYNQPGQRQLEFSVGLRQQEGEGMVRSELRARALLHVNGVIIALAEASYVIVLEEKINVPDIASRLYLSLRPHIENLLAMGGHSPPLPLTLNKVED